MKSFLLSLLVVSLLAGCASRPRPVSSETTRHSVNVRDRQDTIVTKSSVRIGEVKGNFAAALRVDVVEFRAQDETRRERFVEVSQAASSALLSIQQCDTLSAALDEMAQDKKAAPPFSSQRQSFKSSSGVSIFRFENKDNYSCRIDVKPEGVVWVKPNNLKDFRKLLSAAKQKL